MTITSVEDPPLVLDEAEKWRVHRTAGLYFVNVSGVAHAEVDCMFVDPETVVNNRRWHVGSDAECRAAKCTWCVACCS